MDKINLVIGGAGFLGNNTIRELLNRGEKVRTTVRNTDFKEPFKGLDCEIVQADLLDKTSLVEAMKDVDIVYNCAAIYKTWAKNPQEEIVKPNIEGTRNLLEASAEAKIKRLIYVSSAMVLSKDNSPINEQATWNEESEDFYTLSKIQSEKLALELAKKYNLDIIYILPSGMIGPHSYGHIPPAMDFYYNVMANKVPFDPCFYFNIVDVRDVAKWMVIIAKKALAGERYILGPENYITTTQVFELAHKLYPEIQIKPKRNRSFLMTIAFIMETISKISGKKPLLQRSLIKQFLDSNYCFDISKAKRNFGFNPKLSLEAVEELLHSIAQNKKI